MRKAVVAMELPEVGETRSLEWEVTEEVCTRRGEHWIFSTPSMIRLAEFAAIEVLRPNLSAEQGSVGTLINAEHLAPTPLGMNVRAVARVTAHEGRRVDFDIDVFDDVEKVGAITHTRYVIDIPRYVDRLESKLLKYRER
jgi:fluoroacetyl-CoA thioesterase